MVALTKKETKIGILDESHQRQMTDQAVPAFPFVFLEAPESEVER